MNDNLSRIEKFGRRRQVSGYTEPIDPTTHSDRYAYDTSEDKDGAYREDAQENENVADVPSRRVTYPSQRLKITRLFFNFLLFIFIAILFMLLWWGISESPWGKVHM